MTENAEFTPAPLLDQVVTREAAPAAIEQLRADRANGKISQDFYFKRSDYLHGVLSAEASGAPPALPQVHETEQQALERTYAEQMAPPEHAGQYRGLSMPELKGFSPDQAEAFDVGVRNVLYRGGVPQHLAGPLVENVAKTLNDLSAASDGQREAAIATSKEQLHKWWGAEFQTRLDRVSDLIATMAEGDDYVGQLIDRAPWMFAANPGVMDYLDRVASHRARRG